MQKITLLRSSVAVVLLSLSTSTLAREFSYDYVQGTYLSISDDSLGVDVDGNGFAFSGSFSVSPNIAITALFGSTSFDRVFGIEVDATELDFGITAHTSIAPNTDITGNFSVVNVDVEADDGFSTATIDDTGNAISLGLRHMISQMAELNVGFSRVDVFDDAGTTTSFAVRFYTDSKLSFSIGYSTGDDVDTISFNARFDVN